VLSSPTPYLPRELHLESIKQKVRPCQAGPFPGSTTFNPSSQRSQVQNAKMWGSVTQTRIGCGNAGLLGFPGLSGTIGRRLVSGIPALGSLLLGTAGRLTWGAPRE